MASTLWTASDPPRTQSFDLGVAFGYRAARDDLLVPLVFQGPDLQIDARYRHRVGPGFLNGAVDFGLGLVMDRHLHLGLSIDHALRLGYLRRLPKSGSRYLALGPVIGIGADALYPDRWDDAHLYWIGTGWAGLGLERSRPLAGGWRLTASAELALAGLVSRPPIYRLEKQDPLNRVGFHLFGIHRDSTLEWINTYQHARLAFDLDRFKRPSLLRRSIGLEAKLVRVADPELAVAFQASVRYSIGLGR